ncbi:lipocalin-like domain-containing protein [Mycolicibacterium sp. CBM1]
MTALQGAWQLVSCQRDTGNGRLIEYPHGANPCGTLLYTSDNRVSVHLSARDRPPLSSEDLTRISDDEAARAFGSYLGYCGLYRVSGDTVIHSVQVCSVPNMVGTELVRTMTLTDNSLVLRAPTVETADGPQRLTLHWNRIC